MIICSCEGISDQEYIDALRSGELEDSAKDSAKFCRVRLAGASCGSCRSYLESLKRRFAAGDFEGEKPTDSSRDGETGTGSACIRSARSA